MSDHLRVLVAVPSGASWDAQFSLCLINMISNFPNQRTPGYRSQELRVANVRSSILPKNRMDLVKAARAFNASHILFLDTDHTFPMDLIQRLASRGKLVVAANCVTKTLPANPTARAKSADNPQGVPVYSDPGMSGLEEVWRVGTGVMLINMQVFDRIGLGVWDMKYLPEFQTYQGEDWTFCEACQSAGIPIFVDHGVSLEVGHIGQLEYTHQYVGA